MGAAMNEDMEIAKRIYEADAILIGASNGLSITEGIHLFANNQDMHELFGDLQRKYGLQNLLMGMMTRWDSPEQFWGFWSRMIAHYCRDYEPTPVMKNLREIVGDKEYFIVTSNGEQHFQASGFSENRVFEIEGDWLHMTCSGHCCSDIVSGMDAILKMAEAEKDGVVPARLVPLCPHCGAPMITTMAAGVVSRDGREAYEKFLEENSGKRLVILELGIGARNQLIKALLMRLTAREKNATYVAFNLSELYIAPEIEEKSFAVQGSLDETLAELREAVHTISR